MTRGPGRHSERNFRAAEQHNIIIIIITSRSQTLTSHEYPCYQQQVISLSAFSVVEWLAHQRHLHDIFANFKKHLKLNCLTSCFMHHCFSTYVFLLEASLTAG